VRPTTIALACVLALGVVACSADSDVSRALGARCDRIDDCDERCLADDEDYPGGFCSVSCMADRDCPGGSRCVDKDGGVCLFECSGDPACEFLDIGWQCKSKDALPSGEVMVCIGD